MSHSDIDDHERAHLFSGPYSESLHLISDFSWMTSRQIFSITEDGFGSAQLRQNAAWSAADAQSCLLSAKRRRDWMLTKLEWIDPE